MSLPQAASLNETLARVASCRTIPLRYVGRNSSPLVNAGRLLSAKGSVKGYEKNPNGGVDAAVRFHAIVQTASEVFSL
jgi:hypothetical protein